MAIMTDLGLTEAEILNISFVSPLIKRYKEVDDETSKTVGVLFGYNGK